MNASAEVIDALTRIANTANAAVYSDDEAKLRRALAGICAIAQATLTLPELAPSSQPGAESPATDNGGEPCSKP